MTVYLVVRSEYEHYEGLSGFDIEKVFDSKEKAVKYKKEIWDDLNVKERKEKYWGIADIVDYDIWEMELE